MNAQHVRPMLIIFGYLFAVLFLFLVIAGIVAFISGKPFLYAYTVGVDGFEIARGLTLAMSIFFVALFGFVSLADDEEED